MDINATEIYILCISYFVPTELSKEQDCFTGCIRIGQFFLAVAGIALKKCDYR